MIYISDVTMKQSGEGFALSFKEKIELSKLLDRMGVSTIELTAIQNPRTDALLVKSIAAAVSESEIAVPVALNVDSIEQTWNALSAAKAPRLQVCAPVSSVQMEYLHHKKPDAMITAIDETVCACSKLCKTEFIAEDATRSDPEFLRKAIRCAIASGAGVVTVSDNAGRMLPAELAAFIRELRADIPELSNVNLGVAVTNDLAMADACVIAAISEGVTEIKAATYPINTASVSNVARIFSERNDYISDTCSVRTTQLSRIIEQIHWVCQSGKHTISTATEAQDQDLYLTCHDSLDAVSKVIIGLGYDLSQEDTVRVYDAFSQIASKKDKVSVKEFDAIIASAAMQVPQAYKLVNYVITSGNQVSSTAHLKLSNDGKTLEGVCIGDGPIDAAFLAIEQITGRHYELDDFQIQSVTEGREAMGQTIVKLRWAGKLYSGKGISTDIVGASIHAYLSALNKIVYEEDEV